MEFSDLIALVGTIGGVQGVVEVGKWWQSRRSRRREEEFRKGLLLNQLGSGRHRGMQLQ